MDTMAAPEIVLTGFNVLLESVTSDDRTESGIIMPDNKHDTNKLSVGVVRAKGPGFIFPFPKQTDDVSMLINEGNPQPQYLALDIDVGDTVYYSKAGAETLILMGKTYVVVPYPAIKVFTRR